MSPRRPNKVSDDDTPRTSHRVPVIASPASTVQPSFKLKLRYKRLDKLANGRILDVQAWRRGYIRYYPVRLPHNLVGLSALRGHIKLPLTREVPRGTLAFAFRLPEPHIPNHRKMQ